MALNGSSSTHATRWMLVAKWALCTATSGASLISCGSKYEGCEATRTCDRTPGGAGEAGAPTEGSGGSRTTAGGGNGGDSRTSSAAGTESAAASSGGSAGLDAPGGAGGAVPEPECVDDADCSDGQFCTGEELCRDGQCVAGDAACPNPDPEHCSTECDEASQRCLIDALDSDEDGFQSAHCEANPGADCDDTNDQVHPGALETCDGIDNDCNGLSDTADGLPLSGETRLLVDSDLMPSEFGIHADLEWSPAGQVFGIFYFWAGPETKGRAFGNLEPHGGVRQMFRYLQDSSPGADIFYGPHMAWGGNSFAVSFGSNGRGGERALYMRFGFGGEVLLGEPHDTSFRVHDIAYRGGEKWLRPMRTPLGFQIDITSDQETQVEGAVLETEAEIGVARVAVSGDESATVLQTMGSRDISWVRWSPALEPLASEPLATNGSGPDIIDVDGGYAIAWATATGLRLVGKNAEDGETECGPVEVPLGDGQLREADEVALTRDDQFVWALVAKATRVELFRFDFACQLMTRAVVTDTAQAASHPDIAVGGGQVALSWNDTAQPLAPVDRQTRTRLVSEMLCE